MAKKLAGATDKPSAGTSTERKPEPVSRHADGVAYSGDEFLVACPRCPRADGEEERKTAKVLRERATDYLVKCSECGFSGRKQKPPLTPPDPFPGV